MTCAPVARSGGRLHRRFAGAVYNINQVSLRQAITPPRMQGRMNATMRFIVWGTIPIGSILGGFLGGAIGLHDTIWIGAIGGIFAFVPLLFSPVRSLMKMPAPMEEQPVGNATETPRERAIETLGEAVDDTPRPMPGVPRPEVPARPDGRPDPRRLPQPSRIGMRTPRSRATSIARS